MKIARFIVYTTYFLVNLILDFGGINMAKLDDHPTVIRHRQSPVQVPPKVVDAEWLRRLCLEAGADDVGFVSIGRPELDDQREDILRLFPWTKGLVSIVCKMNREPVRSPARSVANLEFHHTGEWTNEVASAIVAALEDAGHRAVNPSMGFPMEMDRVPDKIWVVSHKPVAVAAGLGQMGIHRNVIHPRFGNFILLATILIDAEISQESSRLDYNPCLECKLCVAACPVGAISADGHFDFSACYTHNYREFLGGFGDWVESVVESKNPLDYRRRVSDSETASVWQSLGFGPAIPGVRFSPSKHAGFDLPFRKLIAHNAFPNSLSYRLGRWSGLQWLLLSVKHERPFLLMPCSALSAAISVLFPIRGRARWKSPWTTP